MIKFINVTKLYSKNIYALRDVSFHVAPGEFVSIVGKSGAGKSTIIKLLIAEEEATGGKIMIGGWDITYVKQKHLHILRKQIGVVFQDFKLLHQKTIFENIAFALEVIGERQKRINEIVPRLLRIVNLEKKKDNFPYELSAGEQQRAAIARALAHRPKIILADEPTGNLDSITTREIIEIFKKINQLGTTMLLVTHNREVVNLLEKRVITLDKGRIVGDQPHGRYVI
ncbi:MAG: cell division ATP-binding protein FtsE [Parcubacteria group bacterium]|nr:cell division ATP-binding protein FtsE [Parcubacteria group bacterium]